MGYDIDENAIIRCRDNLATLKTNQTHLILQCCNFLDLNREEIESHANQRSKSIKPKRLIFLGGPPYTSGVGSGETIDRDLPSQFIMHSILNLGAEFVSFILPVRCNKYVKDLKDQINKKCFQCIWSCTIHELEVSEFNFLQKTVIQPSVIHCWAREAI